ncbi:kinase [Thraustotheca clavata]|uniref:Kinase n=1 Tax=Thraustotheca clavata TaxID=74557 RepID=A0A1W0A8T1_9STRA|nr:kinase [Thraustotheca clavata]
MRWRQHLLALSLFSTVMLMYANIVWIHQTTVSSNFLRSELQINPCIQAHVAKLTDPSRYNTHTGCDFAQSVAHFKPFDLPLHCANMHELQLGDLLGEGYWRSVYKSTWHGQEVAIKVVHPHQMHRRQIVQRHVEEASVLYQLKDASNIVKLLGWCNTTLVVDYFPLNLAEVLMDPSIPQWSTQRVLELCLDAAKGVAELHAVSAAHMDLQPRQFLVSIDKRRLYLNDFNRMRYTGYNRLDKTEPCSFEIKVAKGLYRSPEEYMQLPLSEKADIFSLAHVFWALQARDKPFAGLSREEVYEQVPLGLRPDYEPLMKYPTTLRALINEMWAINPEERPSAQDIVSRLKDILESSNDDADQKM